MPEAKSDFARRLMEGREGDGKSFTSERQLTAQAFELDVETRDALQSEGFPWSHYSGRKYSNKGTHECLVILFGERAVEIEGHNLKPLVQEIREGRLNGVKEMLTSQVELLHADASDEPIISSVKTYPDFEEMLSELKGDNHDIGFARKVRGR